MAQDIIIRKAKKDYVCECCGHIIKEGTEYLDKVVFASGKFMNHERYHDECPKEDPLTLLLMRIIASGGELFATHYDGTKICVVGIAYKAYNEPVILYKEWDSNKKLAMNVQLANCFLDINNKPLIGE